jgi:hypothetical protein
LAVPARTAALNGSDRDQLHLRTDGLTYAGLEKLSQSASMPAHRETDCRNVSRRKPQAQHSEEWARRLIDRVDAMDTEGWLEFLSDDARFCFGNAPPVAGKSAIRQAVNAFFSGLAAIKHDLAEIWISSGTVIFRGKASYTRADGSALTIPFANILKLDDQGLVAEYLVYADTSSL